MEKAGTDRKTFIQKHLSAAGFPIYLIFSSSCSQVNRRKPTLLQFQEEEEACLPSKREKKRKMDSVSVSVSPLSLWTLTRLKEKEKKRETGEREERQGAEWGWCPSDL